MNVHEQILDDIGKLVRPGDRFGKWRVHTCYRVGRSAYARCMCDCNSGFYKVAISNLVSGKSKQCVKCRAKAMLGNKRSQHK